MLFEHFQTDEWNFICNFLADRKGIYLLELSFFLPKHNKMKNAGSVKKKVNITHPNVFLFNSFALYPVHIVIPILMIGSNNIKNAVPCWFMLFHFIIERVRCDLIPLLCEKLYFCCCLLLLIIDFDKINNKHD